MNEMDKTGQGECFLKIKKKCYFCLAFEEMQEQNLRLIQDVRDKDKGTFFVFYISGELPEKS